MATIITKNSATPSQVPSSLTQGELAINVTDGKIFYGSGSGNIVKELSTGGSPFPYTGSAIITGSLTVTGSIISTTGITGSLQGTASYSTQALTSSLALGISASNINSTTSETYDSSNTPSINWDVRRLIDSPGNVSVAWEERLLTDAGAFSSIDWGNRLLSNDDGTTSIDWGHRSLLDTNDWESLDYQDRRLVANDGVTTAADWATPGTILFSGSLIPAGPYTDNTSSYDLGSSTAAWRDLYISNGSIKMISGSQQASISFVNGDLDFGSTPIHSPNVIKTVSVDSNTLTFTRGNGTSFPITVNTGSGGGTQKIYNFIQSTDGTAVTGTTNITLTSTLLIPANTAGVGDSISLKARALKTGANGTSKVYIYANTSATLSGAILLATGPATGATNLVQQLSREFVIKSTTITNGFSSTILSYTDDTAVSTITNSNIDWTVNQYFIFAILNQSIADSSKSTYTRVTILKP